MSLIAMDLSTGPQLEATELGVHIIYVPDDAVGAGPTTPAMLQDVLSLIGLPPKFTDIVVFRGQPWHCAFGKLREHPRVHHDYPQTRLTLFRKVNHKAVWWSENEFNILKIAPDGEQRTGTIDNPFKTTPATASETAQDFRTIFVARSPVPVPESDYQEYKMSFKITTDGREVDPNTYCDGGGG